MPSDKDYGRWVNFRYLEQNGIEKRKLQFPTRPRLLVRTALERIGLKYRETEPFYNPLYNGYKNQTIGSVQWLDFVVYLKSKRRILVILFNPKHGTGGLHKRQKESFNSKCKYMEQRNIPYTVIPKTYSSYEYEIVIRRTMNRLETK